MGLITIGKEYPNRECAACGNIFKEYQGCINDESDKLPKGEFVCTGCILDVIQEEMDEEDRAQLVIAVPEKEYIFTKEQKEAIKYLIDSEASRGFLQETIRDEKYWTKEYELFKDMSDEEFDKGISEMVEDRTLTEGSKENERDWCCLVVTEWKPNTALDIRTENLLVRMDPDRYNRARRLKAEKEEEKNSIKLAKAQELQKRVEKRVEWLQNNVDGN